MVRTLTGNLFDSKAQTLVNTVNCVGVMGKGIALEFKKRFPDMYEDYRKRCAARQVRLGQPYLFCGSVLPWILNFPTKDDWRSVSRLSDIVAGLRYLEEHYRGWGITSLAVPPLGCGQGQLDWKVVGPTLYRHLSRLDIPVELYAPHGTPKEQLELAFLQEAPTERLPVEQVGERPRINPAWVALVEIVARIEQQPYHWPVGRVTFQKIAYFATEAGIPTGLQFARSSFGPFSPDLKRLATTLVNNGLLQEQKLGQMFAIKPGPTYEDAVKSYKADLAQWESVINRIVDLFLRMRTQQAEVAATVHFAALGLARGGQEKPTEAEVLGEVKRWKQRRHPPLKDKEIASTIRSLNILGWLKARPSLDLPVPKEALLDV